MKLIKIKIYNIDENTQNSHNIFKINKQKKVIKLIPAC